METREIARKIELIAEETNFSGVVSVVEKEIRVFEKPFGCADRSNRLENTVQTRFGMASGSKAFTALAIWKLIQDGSLSLDSKAVDCIHSGLPNLSTAVTIRHLLTHTSGVADYYDEEEEDDFDNFFVDIPWHQLKSPKDYVPLFINEPMKFKPGERFSYSNGGYILLGIVIEDVAGIPYRSFVEENVLCTLGMTESGFFPLNELPERTAYGYVTTNTGWRTNVYNLPIIGASDGGAFTTARDMKAFWRALLDHRLLGRETLGLFLAPCVAVGSPEEHRYYGHGFWMFEVSEREFVYYLEGCDAGVSFHSLCVPRCDLVATVLSNTTDGAWPLVRAIREHVVSRMQ